MSFRRLSHKREEQKEKGDLKLPRHETEKKEARWLNRWAGAALQPYLSYELTA